MKITIPKIVKPMSLAEYDAAFGAEAVVQVWINPPREKMLQYWQWVRRIAEIQDPGAEELDEVKQIGEQMVIWFSEIWSQGPADTAWTEDEIRELVGRSQETDPQLWPWMSGKTIRMIQEHRNEQKKV